MRAGRGGTSKGNAGEGREDELMTATGFDPAGTGHNVSPHALGDKDRSRGVYDPALDKDSCGVGFIAGIKGRKSHKIIDNALTILVNLEHRGAVGADPRAGDGAGILVQIPHKFFAKQATELGFTLPKPGSYAVGALFMPHDAEWRQEIMGVFAEETAREGMRVVGWRDGPTNKSPLRPTGKPNQP